MWFKSGCRILIFISGLQSCTDHIPFLTGRKTLLLTRELYYFQLYWLHISKAICCLCKKNGNFKKSLFWLKRQLCEYETSEQFEGVLLDIGCGRRIMKRREEKSGGGSLATRMYFLCSIFTLLHLDWFMWTFCFCLPLGFFQMFPKGACGISPVSIRLVSQ